MIPYLYTMNRRCYEEDIPLVLPMYYEYPGERAAYEVKNQYLFGSRLVVAPVTTPRIDRLNVSKVSVWLPKGTWHDIYTGTIYDGGRMIEMFRSIESIPVLAKAGAILPFTDEISGACAGRNPESLYIRVFTGGDGKFVLYEDDNVSCGYEDDICVRTEMSYIEKDGICFIVNGAAGELSLIPDKRSYTVEFNGIRHNAADNVCVTVNGEESEADVYYNNDAHSLVVRIPCAAADDEVKVNVAGDVIMTDNDVPEKCFGFLNQAEIDFLLKDKIYNLLENRTSDAAFLSELYAMDIDRELYGVITEIVTAKCGA